ncbi:DEAD-box ATP-dependent RNA helicase [Musa troglodytarum]|uniref:DEAD-box ATP-dependent RNA helicase n=1 Tax=Musa troglodytarum TaxID=320322 RepID=A0A9E7JBC4_9LILI|nr:DEAD-box ATP-dependent RNA helicase [Musa troglodytarum]
MSFTLVSDIVASRGIDFAGVDHVALFDFPCDPSEYGRHVGRTAQGAGGKGKAYVFVVGRQVSLARRILWKGTRKAIHCTIYLARVQRHR